MGSMKKFQSLALMTLAGIVLADSYFGVGRSARAAETQEVTIRFRGMVGEQPFRCGESYSLGTTASLMTPTDFRLYISDVALIDANGNPVPLTLQQDGKWQYETVALLDFEDKSGACTNGTVEMNDRIIGTVPAGDYSGLQFTLGVPFELNHADATLAPSPLNLTSLWWNWQFGYKFARIDLSHQHQTGMLPSQSLKHENNQPHGHGEESNTGFAIHLGSTGCEIAEGSQSPSSCSYPNRSTMTFTGFNPAQNVVVADLAALVANTDLSRNQPDTAPGCMSEPTDSDCAGIMEAIGLAFNGTLAQDQSFFRME